MFMEIVEYMWIKIFRGDVFVWYRTWTSKRFWRLASGLSGVNWADSLSVFGEAVAVALSQILQK